MDLNKHSIENIISKNKTSKLVISRGFNSIRSKLYSCVLFPVF